MAVLKQNNAEGGTALTDVTAANSGGASGNAFDTVQTGTAHEYRSTTFSYQGSLGYLHENQNTWDEWNITATEFWGSGYWMFYPSPLADPNASTTVFMQALGASDAQAASLEYDTSTGKIAVTGVGGTGKATTTGTHVHLQWMRIDWHFKMHATAGVAEARIYFDVVGAPNTYETITETSALTLGTMTKLRIGITNAPAVYLWHAFDDLIIDDAAWVVRGAAAFTGVPRPQLNIYRM